MAEAFTRLLALVRSGLGFQIGVEPLREHERHIWNLARQHKVASILCPGILESNADAKWKDEARYYWQLAALRERYYVRSAEEVMDVLGRSEIQSYALKGVELARSVYPKPGMRAFRDVDLLVAPDSVEAADELLRREGFLQLSPSGPLARAVRARGSAVAAARSGLDALSYEREDLFLEIHTSILPPSLGSYPLSHVFRDQRGLSAEDFFVHLCFHTSRHHFLHALRQLSDIALWCLIKKPDFYKVIMRLEENGTTGVAQPAWALAHEFFPESVPKPFPRKSRMLSLYTERVRKHIGEMPAIAVALSGSPLPFLMSQGRLCKSLWGGSAHRDYQVGEGAGVVRRMSWNLSRPFHLLHRHLPVLKTWLSFALRN